MWRNQINNTSCPPLFVLSIFGYGVVESVGHVKMSQLYINHVLTMVRFILVMLIVVYMSHQRHNTVDCLVMSVAVVEAHILFV